MKKVILCMGLFLLVGCSLSSTAKSPVEAYLKSYNNLDYEVLLDMEEVIEAEGLNEKNTILYRDILKKQYQDLSYEVISESYDGNEAIVKVKISVYDYFKVEKEALNILKESPDEFYNSNGVYDHDLYLEYKLNSLKKVTDKVTYTIEFKVDNSSDLWVLNEVSESTLEKIHGIFNYES